MSVVISKSIDITTIGSGGTFDLGWRGNGGVLFVNPTGFIVSLGLQSQSGPLAVLPGQMWKFPLTPQDASIVLNKTLFTSTALSTLLYWTVFNDPHDLDEIPQGQFSSYIANIIGGAGVTAQTLINDGNGAQNIIESTLAGNVSGLSNVLIKNDGTVQISGIGNSGQEVFLSIQPGTPLNSAITLFADQINFNGAQTTTQFSNGFTTFGDITISEGGNNYSFRIFNNNFVLRNLNTNTDILLVTGTGQIITPFPPQLLTGNQETGVCGIQVSNIDVAAGNVFGQGVNFKTHMTNIPSSISFSPIVSTNVTSVTATNITKDGFFFKLTANLANSTTAWFGTYTTVGN